MFPVGTRVFATMVEEAVVVVGMLEREDFGVDEGVDIFQM